MNIEILRKCVEELNRADPKLDYIRGMIETLIAVSNPNKESIAEAAKRVPNFPVTDVPIPPGLGGIVGMVMDSVTTT